MPTKPHSSQYFALVALLLSVTALVLSLFSNNKEKDILVVDKQVLFNQFTMAIELKKQGDVTFNKMKYELDSLNSQLYISKNPAVISGIRLQIERQTEAINDFTTHFSVDETGKVWKRIDGYIKDYARENNCDLIVGAGVEGGDVLYYHPRHDMTSKILAYINRRYEGNK